VSETKEDSFFRRKVLAPLLDPEFSCFIGIQVSLEALAVGGPITPKAGIF
jgi:hypothetical protein